MFIVYSVIVYVYSLQCYSLCLWFTVYVHNWYIKLYFVYRGVPYWEIQCYSLCSYIGTYKL